MKDRRGRIALLLAPLLLSLPSPARPQVTVEGAVTLAPDDRPAVGATVRAAPLGVTAATGPDGRYRLVIPADRLPALREVTFHAEHPGFRRAYRITEVGPGDRLVELFRLRPDTTPGAPRGPVTIQLDSVVTTGTLPRGDSARGDLSSLLSARAAGVAVAGSAGADRIRIRGAPGQGETTLSAGDRADPLLVVDGVALGRMGDDGALAGVRPEDIASLEVLKGASATSIYGARASGGVVHVTTRGGAGPYAIPAPGGALRWTPGLPWPPPRWTTRHDLPPHLLEGGGRTVGGVFERLRDALVRGGFHEWAVYPAGPDGFVVVARLEVIGDDGTPAPSRWDSDDDRPVRPVSWSDYLRALFTARPGRYRVIAFVVSPRPLRPGREPEMAPLTELALYGERGLPEALAARALSPGTRYVALIYEFFRPAADSPTELVRRSRATSVEHLARARLWTPRELLEDR